MPLPGPRKDWIDNAPILGHVKIVWIQGASCDPEEQVRGAFRNLEKHGGNQKERLLATA